MPPDDSASRPPDCDDAICLIEDTIEPNSWSDNGGTGSGKVMHLAIGSMHLLAISNSRTVHAAIEPLFGQLRSMRHVTIAGNAGPPKPVPLDPAEIRIREALARNVVMDFDGKPLHEVIGELTKSARISILLDGRALEANSIPPETPVSIHLGSVSLDSGLKDMLGRLGFVYTYSTYRDDAILLITTSSSWAAEAFCTRFYDVYDLASPPFNGDPHASPGAGRLRPTDRGHRRPHRDPESWADNGGRGQGQVTPLVADGIRVLVVGQSWSVHPKVEAFLRTSGRRDSGARTARRSQFTPAEGAMSPSSEHEVPRTASCVLTAAYSPLPRAKPQAACRRWPRTARRPRPMPECFGADTLGRRNCCGSRRGPGRCRLRRRRRRLAS